MTETDDLQVKVTRISGIDFRLNGERIHIITKGDATIDTCDGLLAMMESLLRDWYERKHDAGEIFEQYADEWLVHVTRPADAADLRKALDVGDVLQFEPKLLAGVDLSDAPNTTGCSAVRVVGK